MFTLRLELEGLKEKMVHAMILEQGRLEDALRSELDKVLTEEYVSKLIEEAIREVFPKAVRDAVHSYFLFGLGRDEIKEAVEQMFGNSNER